jgi:DNA-binding HxlR family transcriptional regulator
VNTKITEESVKRAIRDGARRFDDICKKLGVEKNSRELDRTLQRLRKSGVIWFTSSEGWQVVP